MVAPQPRRIGLRQRFAVDGDVVARLDHIGWRGQRRAVDRDAALLDPLFGVAPRAKPGMGHGLGDAHGLRRL
jgi:hypothetical protein